MPLGLGGMDAGDVIVGAGVEIGGAVVDVFDEKFAAVGTALDGDGAVDAAEGLVWLEADVVAAVGVAIAVGGAGFEPDGDVVVGGGLVFDDGGGDAVVAHDVGLLVEEKCGRPRP